MTRKSIATTCLLIMGYCSAADARADKPSIYFDVQAVREPAGTKPSLKKKAEALLVEELKKNPSVVLDLGSPAPKGAALAKALKDRKLNGFGIVLRITKARHAMNPPGPGKIYKVLMVDVEVAIDAEKIPSGQMALAGQGSTQVGTEVSRFKERERVQLLHEALISATRQAVAKSIAKLTPKKERRKRRRGRRKK